MKTYKRTLPDCYLNTEINNMSSTGNIPSVPNNYGSQEGTQLAPGGDFNGQQSQQWQQPGQGQGKDWQQRAQSQQWQDRDNSSQQWQDRDRSQQFQQPGQDQDWQRRGSQAGGTNDANDGNFRPMNVQPAREGEFYKHMSYVILKF